MGKAIPYDSRKKIVERKSKGFTSKEVAQEFGYSQSAVNKIWYQYKKEGESAFYNNYQKCGQSKAYSKEIQDLSNELRDNQQGGVYIRCKLESKYPNLSIPSERTLQRWWKEQGTNRKKGRPNQREKKDGAKFLIKPGK
jgi:transposase